MILLLQGQSDIGRITLAEKIASEVDQWRHVPVESLLETPVFQMIQGDIDEELLLGLAVHLARELAGEGFHTVLTYPDASEHIPAIKKELGDSFCAVHLMEEENKSPCDHVIITKDKSVNDLFALIRNIFKSAPST
ncbi:hypothetical protein A2635_00840 [Candidatus Peribacteria bacterium RIFCSPHIGHO2_01_FULL_51_9]|nr:MAG: hypothetical protein A2635_00840 [Candidatus Peribacteria bacterium RIFCSPHIGHO2_01_FULL_51_9]